MNDKQKSILSGRKPKHRDGKPTLDDAAKMIRYGPSPLASAFEWLFIEEQLHQAILNHFCVPAKWLDPTGAHDFEQYKVRPQEPPMLYGLPVVVEPMPFYEFGSHAEEKEKSRQRYNVPEKLLGEPTSQNYTDAKQL